MGSFEEILVKKHLKAFKKDESTRNDSESAGKEPAFDSRRSI